MWRCGTWGNHRLRTPSTVRGLLPPPAGGPPPSRREVWGFRRSKPAALPSIGYRGFAVAPISLRAPSRNIVVITVTGAAIYETGAQCAPLQGTTVQPTVAMIKPSVANASHRFDFRHVVGARIARPPTLFKPSIFHPKDLPPRGRGTVRRRWKEFSGGGRRPSPSLLCRTSFYFPTHARHTRHKKHMKHMKHTRNRS